MLAAKAQASLYIGAFVVLKCDKYQISRFFLSRLTQAAKTQAGLCIGISSTEPSFLENAITVHGEIFQIKHWNISIKGNKNLFSEIGCYWKHRIRTPIQGLHCLPRYKDKDFKPLTQRTITKSNPERDFFSFMSVSNGLDTDHG